MNYAQLVIIAILVEAIWENLKMIWDKNKLNFNMLGSLLLAMTLCTIFKLDAFPIIGLSTNIPVIGSLLTGIIVSRGANAVNDLFKKVKGE